MRILHTSDWHLGHKLYGRQRYHEFELFLQWLKGTIEEFEVEALIVAGDIFDSQTPSNRSLELYYRFLSSVAHSCCRHVVITGGNHDSPSLLNGPGELLHFLDIHVIGRATPQLKEEVVVLRGEDDTAELMVLGVPYLRDSDIRLSEGGESPADKQTKLLQGIREHYAKLCILAQDKQRDLGIAVPLLATGHLFCRGGTTRQGDGVRELYVGNLVQVGLDTFPDAIDYLALGHLHQEQMVAGEECRRYSGSPLAMGFNEAGGQKYVLVVDMGEQTNVQKISVPSFQALRKLTGNREQILSEIKALAEENRSILLEIDYQGQSLIDDLQDQIHEAVAETELLVLRISNKQIYDHVMQQRSEIRTLEDLTPRQVFERCLELHEISDQEEKELLMDFDAVLADLLEGDDREE